MREPSGRRGRCGPCTGGDGVPSAVRPPEDRRSAAPLFVRPDSGRAEYDPQAGAGGRKEAVMAGTKVQVRRVYEEPVAHDGTRVLVDRIWPRGLSKEKAALDEWCKNVSPSTELRTWYHHDPERFDEFGRRYRAELEEPERAEALRHLRALAEKRTLTLLTATKRPEISEAEVLADLLRH